MEQQKQKNEELEKKLQETATLKARDSHESGDEGDAAVLFPLCIFVSYVFVSSCLGFKWVALDLKKDMLLYIFFVALLRSTATNWFAMSWKEEVEKKRQETEELQNKLQEASAMQALTEASALLLQTV